MTRKTIAAGGKIYRQTCMPCHGPDGQGGHGGGAPLTNATDPATVGLAQ